MPIEFSPESIAITKTAFASKACRPRTVLLSLVPLFQTGDLQGMFLALDAWVSSGASVQKLIKYARDNRGEGEFGPFLRYLSDQLCQGTGVQDPKDVRLWTKAAREWVEENKPKVD